MAMLLGEDLENIFFIPFHCMVLLGMASHDKEHCMDVHNLICNMEKIWILICEINYFCCFLMKV